MSSLRTRIERLEGPGRAGCVECEFEAMPTWTDGRLVPAPPRTGPCTHPRRSLADVLRELSEMDQLEKTHAIDT